MLTKCIFTEQAASGGGGSGGVTLSKIEITTPPNKINYLSGESFDPIGMVVQATYNIGNIKEIVSEITGYSITPQILTDGITEVIITYTEGGITCSASQAITVKRVLMNIEVTTLPNKTNYEYLDTLDTSGIVVTAIYSDNKNQDVTASAVIPSITFDSIGTKNIPVSYTEEDGIAKETTFQVTVDRKSVAKPTWKSNLVYNGNDQSVNDVNLWNNYDINYMTMSGTTTSVDAGTYTAIFNLKDNYRWNGIGSIEALNVNWIIDKAVGSLGVSTNNITFNANNLSSDVTITRNSTGAITYSPTNINGLTINLNGDILTITGDGSTAVPTTEITISAAEDNNYTAPTPQKITVSAFYWEWGDENAEGDAAWWAGLKNWIQTTTHEERLACEGKTKTVKLSTKIQGINFASMRCIGADQDGDKTLAFQTVSCLPYATAFDINSAVWTTSTVNAYCQNFYNYCSAKDSIKVVSKGTCLNQNNDRDAAVTYSDETVFLPSEREMGLDSYSPLSVANSTTTKAECTYGYNEAYHYYTDNNKRIKYSMDEYGTIISPLSYWVRSRYYSLSYQNRVCRVYADGSARWGTYSSSSNGGFAPAFVIG